MSRTRFIPFVFWALAFWMLAAPGRVIAQAPKPAPNASRAAGVIGAPAGPDESSGAVEPAPMADQQNLLVDIKSQLAALQTQLERAERRVAVLKAGVLGGPIVATNVVLAHRNEVGGPYVLDRATYILDGGVIFEEGNATGKLEAQKVIELFNGGLASGPHQLRVVLEFRGRAVGPFTYLEGYGFRVKSGCNFEVVEGRAHRIDVVASEDDNPALDPQDRLSVRCEVDGGHRSGAPDPAATPSGAAPLAPGPAGYAPASPSSPPPKSSAGGR